MGLSVARFLTSSGRECRIPVTVLSSTSNLLTCELLPSQTFNKILIASRGEIACRVSGIGVLWEWEWHVRQVGVACCVSGSSILGEWEWIVGWVVCQVSGSGMSGE